MVILKSIGAFFVKIWRWIKETAWVQPLLIVGAIFAVIFSIPYITEWASDWTGQAEGSFYDQYQETLEGQTMDGSFTTDADRLAETLAANEDAIAAGNYDEIDKTTYGEKFFFVVYQEDCTGCNNAEEGLRYLRENWGNYRLSPTTEGETFALHTIDASQESTNDDDDIYQEMGSVPSAFNRWTIKHVNLFQQLQTDWDWENSNYKVNENIGDGDYKSFFLDVADSSDPTDALGAFPVPSIVLVDYTDEAIGAGVVGMREVIFSVSGDTEIAKAELLMKMWNHCEAPNANNPFTDYNN